MREETNITLILSQKEVIDIVIEKLKEYSNYDNDIVLTNITINKNKEIQLTIKLSNTDDISLG